MLYQVGNEIWDVLVKRKLPNDLFLALAWLLTIQSAYKFREHQNQQWKLGCILSPWVPYSQSWIENLWSICRKLLGLVEDLVYMLFLILCMVRTLWLVWWIGSIVPYCPGNFSCKIPRFLMLSWQILLRRLRSITLKYLGKKSVLSRKEAVLASDTRIDSPNDSSSS